MASTPIPPSVEASPPPRHIIPVPSSFKYPDFLRYWLGLLVSVIGYQMLVLFALGWLIFKLTDDARWVGAMTATVAAPAIVLNLFGGVFADKLNPKRLLGITQGTTGIVVVVLAVLDLQDVVNKWHVLAAAFLIGAVQAFDSPSRQSIFPRLVEREALPNAVAAVSIIWTGTRIISPTIAGILIAQTSVSTAIFVSAAGFLALCLISQTLKVPPAERARGGLFTEMFAGFLFIKRSPIFSFLIGMTFFNSLFGMSYIFLMPVFAKEVMEVGAQKIAWLMGSSGVGAVAGIFVVANMGRFQSRGWLLVGGAVFFGTFLIIFAVTSHLQMYGLSMVILFVAGFANSVYLLSVMTALHRLVPDHFRGRIMGFYSITWSMAPLGGLQANFIAHYVNAPVAVALGGALVCAFALAVGLGNRRVRDLGVATLNSARERVAPC